MEKKQFKRQFIKRTFTRFHMSLILLGTILCGVVFSKLLLVAGLENMLIRFVVVLGLAYLCFLLLLKLWLHYLTAPYRKGRRGGIVSDAADVLTGIPDFSSTGEGRVVSGHGGEFGGGGASEAWEGGRDVSELSVSQGAVGAGESIGETAAGTAGDALSVSADEGGLVLIPLILLLLGILGGGIYVMYEAPVILSEAAFELILASSLIKRARQIDSPNWIGSVFRSTWPALLLTLVIAIAAGWGLMAYCPQASKITEVFQYCL